MNTIFELVSPGLRPPFSEVAFHLWGPECNFDSDGDSNDPQSPNWTELRVILRNDSGGWLQDDGVLQRVDIDPISFRPLTLRITSKDKSLSNSTAEFLLKTCGGTLRQISD